MKKPSSKKESLPEKDLLAKPPALDSMLSAQKQREEPIPQKAVAILKAKLGQHEEGGNNEGPIVEWAISRWTHQKPDGTGWARWCAGAVCTALAEAGSQLILQVGSLSVRVLWRNLYEQGLVYFKSPSLDHPKNSRILPQQGDLVFFGKDYPAHVALLDEYDGIRHTLKTIEGNVKDSVSALVHQSWYGFARIEK